MEVINTMTPKYSLSFICSSGLSPFSFPVVPLPNFVELESDFSRGEIICLVNLKRLKPLLV